MSATLPRVLLTGFDPFGGETLNPSWEAVRGWQGRRMAGHRIETLQLPTEFAAAQRILSRAMRELTPSLLLGVGQAGGRPRLSIERVAINIKDARIPDNAGAQPIDEPVLAGAPAAYFSNLPIKHMLASLHAAGLPAEISNSAGTYVCNHVAYLMLHLATRRRGVRAGFIHIPYLPQQAIALGAVASMALDDMQRGLGVALRAALSRREDRQLGAGTLD